MDYKNILVIGAHPDDIEYGCMGFLKSYSKKADIHIYVSSVGSLGDPTCGKKRKWESTQALATLKPKTFILREKKGILPDNFQEILHDMEAIICGVKPDLILTHGPHDTHQEHKLIYEILLSAARRKKVSIMLYAIVSNTSFFNPNYFFELDDEMINLKIKQLAFHESQSDKHYMTADYIRDFHKRPYSMLHGMNYCEAFEIERMMY